MMRWPATTRSPPFSYSLAPTNSSITERCASLTCRNSGSRVSRPSSSATQAAVPTLPTPTTLRARVDELELVEQDPALVRQREAVLEEQALRRRP